jgi:protease I
MSEQLRGKRIAFLTANEGVEQVELTEPLKAVREAGAEAALLAPEQGDVQAFDHLDKGDVLIEADVVRGRTLTSWPSLQTDLRNAGAE